MAARRDWYQMWTLFVCLFLHCRHCWHYLLVLYLVCRTIRSSDRKLPINLLTYLLITRRTVAAVSSRTLYHWTCVLCLFICGSAIVFVIDNWWSWRLDQHVGGEGRQAGTCTCWTPRRHIVIILLNYIKAIGLIPYRFQNYMFTSYYY